MRAAAIFVLMVSVLAWSAPAQAFCGFYVSGADTSLYNNASVVVLMRDGQRTILSMQNNYGGPPQDFAMVVPVPVVLHQDDVKTLSPDIFDRVDRLSAPRLVEYWEQDPCAQDIVDQLGSAQGIGMGRGRLGGGHGVGGLGVTVMAEFTVGEYQIVILSANDSVGLDTWLHVNGYKIPPGAAPLLRPYVQAGMKFFVAKVDAHKVKFDNGQAKLSPLRFHYDSPTFSLPVRLGLVNSSGTQDLIVNILARGKRYEVGNYPNVTIPTNLDLAENARSAFPQFYASLFDRALERSPHAVVTEYSWQALSCDPCPEPPLNESELATLGGDVIPGVPSGSPAMRLQTQVQGRLPPEVVQRIVRQNLGRARLCYENGLRTNPKLTGTVAVKFVIGRDGAVAAASDAGSSLHDGAVVSCIVRGMSTLSFPQPEAGIVTAVARIDFSEAAAVPTDFVLTRLHARYSKDSLGADLVFTPASPIEGGREDPSASGVLETGPHSAAANDFQARYAIRHPWGGPIACAKPVRGVWGGPPDGVTADFSPRAAQDLATAPRDPASLASFLRTDVPQLGVRAEGVAVGYLPLLGDAGVGAGDAGPDAGAVDASGPPTQPDAASPPLATPPQSGRGCTGCAESRSGLGGDVGFLAGALALLAALGRRRAR